jgi:hypothetical protein
VDVEARTEGKRTKETIVVTYRDCPPLQKQAYTNNLGGKVPLVTRRLAFSRAENISVFIFQDWFHQGRKTRQIAL